MTERSTSPSNLWFQPSEADPDSGLRLFLFPHAGSGASIYKEWPELLPGDIAHHCVQLPGRQDRSAEDMFTEMEPLVEALQDAITQELDDRPFAFFGHCMGAQLAYRLAVALEKSGRQGPVIVGVSGWAPKDFKTPTLEQAYMPIEELKEWIRELGSVPTEIMDDPKALEMIIPAMRADLAVVASYLDDGAPLSCPIVSYSGNKDQLMGPGAMASWTDRTSSYLGNSEFHGDHFYMNNIDNTIGVTSDLVRHIKRAAAR
jgi:surfactin synthase thioesterase subunit